MGMAQMPSPVLGNRRKSKALQESQKCPQNSSRTSSLGSTVHQTASQRNWAKSQEGQRINAYLRKARKAFLRPDSAYDMVLESLVLPTIPRSIIKIGWRRERIIAERKERNECQRWSEQTWSLPTAVTLKVSINDFDPEEYLNGHGSERRRRRRNNQARPDNSSNLSPELRTLKQAQERSATSRNSSISDHDLLNVLPLFTQGCYIELSQELQRKIQKMSQSLAEVAGNASRSKHLKSRLLSSILCLLKTNDLISSTTAHTIFSTSMYPSGQRGRAHIRNNSMPRIRIPSMTKQLAATFSKLIAASEIPKTRSTLRRHGKKPPPKSKAKTRNPQEDFQEPKDRQPPVLRHEKTAKALWKETKSASAPRRARMTLIITGINPIVVGRFKLTPRGERKLKKLYKAISRDENRHLQDFLEAKKAKKRKTKKRRAERLAKWNLEKRFDVREEICAGAPGFNDGVSERGDEDSSSPDSSDDDGDLSDMIEEYRAADINYHPDTPFNMGGGAQEEEDLQDTDNLNLPDPETEVVLRISLDWQNLGVRYERELRIVFPAFSFWPELSGASNA